MLFLILLKPTPLSLILINIWLLFLINSIAIFLFKFGVFSALFLILSIEFLIRFKKTLLICSLSQFKKILELLYLKSILIVKSISFINLILVSIISIILCFLKTGFGILAK